MSNKAIESKPEQKNRSRSTVSNIRKRDDGRWEARIVVGTDPETGKPIRKSVYAKKRDDVRKKLAAIQNKVYNQDYTEPTKITVEEWFREWLNVFCSKRVTQYTYAAYEGIINNHIVPNIGTIPLPLVNGITIQLVYNKLSDDGKAPKTVKNVSGVLHKGFEVAVRQGLIQTNPCNNAELPARIHSSITPLSDSDIPLFIDAVQHDPFKNAYLVSLFTGMREGECLGLSWKQVDFEKRIITISQQLQRRKGADGKYVIVNSTKSGRPRVIRPPEIVFGFLKDERLKQAENQIAAGSDWQNVHNLVFTTNVGRHVAIFTYYNHFKKIAERIGRPDARPHDLRHTTATMAIASGADIKSVQALLGHSTASFTLNVYTHASEKMLNDTAMRLQAFYDAISSGT